MIAIVDRHDNVLGYKERADIDPTNDIFRTASLWITNGNGDILLAQRAFDKKVDPGKWSEAVGGTVEGNDTYEETIIREAEEELGLTNITMVRGPKQYIEGSVQYFIQWYKAVINEPLSAFTIQQDEVERIAWIPLNGLRKELKNQPEKYIEPMASIVSLLTESNDYLHMSPDHFDQTLSNGWRNLDERGDHLGAARMLENYMHENEARVRQEGGDVTMELLHFHAGQTLATAGEEYYQEAIKHFERSFRNKDYWDSYVSGTIAYLKKDKRGLDQALKAIEEVEKRNPGQTNIAFLKTYKKALDEKQYSYKTAYES